MRFGVVVPFSDARQFTELAVVAEQHGWDGVFTWEALWGADAWVSLGAAAVGPRFQGRHGRPAQRG